MNIINGMQLHTVPKLYYINYAPDKVTTYTRRCKNNNAKLL